jgi:hypothetical protein
MVSENEVPMRPSGPLKGALREKWEKECIKRRLAVYILPIILLWCMNQAG